MAFSFSEIWAKLMGCSEFVLVTYVVYPYLRVLFVSWAPFKFRNNYSKVKCFQKTRTQNHGFIIFLQAF